MQTPPNALTHSALHTLQPMEKTEGFRGYFSINLNTWGIYSNFAPSFLQTIANGTFWTH